MCLEVERWSSITQELLWLGTLIVRRKVTLEDGSSRKCLRTQCALVRLFFCVSPDVVLQGVRLPKCHRTQAADVGTLVSVSPYVLFQVRCVLEGYCTDEALVGSFSTVDADMRL